MLLAIDVGNTNIVFALCAADQRRVLASWRIKTDPGRTADQYAVWLGRLFEMEGFERGSVSGAIIASVVPQTLFHLEAFCSRYFAVEPLVAGGADFAWGVEIRLDNPGEVGADRIVNAVAAHRDPGGDLVIVDFGTATTFDVVGAEGAYLGGVIAPGIHLSMDALYRAAARLPRIAVEPPPEGRGVIGKGTVHAMQSGVFWGYVGLIEGLVARIRDEMRLDGRSEVSVVATGGLAPLFHRHTPAIGRVDGELTIKGLMELWLTNQRTP